MLPVRHVATLEVSPEWQQRLLSWAGGHDRCVVLESQGHATTRWDMLVGVGAVREVVASAGQAFEALRVLQEEVQGDWLMGCLAYDLKNEVEPRLDSHLPDGMGWPDLHFFQPVTVVGIRDGRAYLYTFDEVEVTLKYIDSAPITEPALPTRMERLQARISTSDYQNTVERLRAHIAAGDLYEINFCQEFFALNVEMQPVAVFRRLAQCTHAPMGAFVRMGERYLLCASPERFLQKQGDWLVSQPIKGTRRRSMDPTEDARMKAELAVSEKDRAEHIMIVDLVRNDLARHCQPGSVEVTELMGIYSFQTVHQMISTVVGRLRSDTTALEALKAAFPMGSMTGAPKVMALTLAEQYEQTRRGLYSGAVGYFDPEGGFDFNVVIRSIQYHAALRYVSCLVGGAIVYDSVPEAEYAECLVKLEALRATLEGD
jgi:para-aminobenzoate synthetase component I